MSQFAAHWGIACLAGEAKLHAGGPCARKEFMSRCPVIGPLRAVFFDALPELAEAIFSVRT